MASSSGSQFVDFREEHLFSAYNEVVTHSAEIFTANIKTEVHFLSCRVNKSLKFWT